MGFWGLGQPTSWAHLATFFEVAHTLFLIFCPATLWNGLIGLWSWEIEAEEEDARTVLAEGLKRWKKSVDYHLGRKNRMPELGFGRRIQEMKEKCQLSGKHRICQNSFGRRIKEMKESVNLWEAFCSQDMVSKILKPQLISALLSMHQIFWGKTLWSWWASEICTSTLSSTGAALIC